MKRIGFLTLLLCIYLAPAAWLQAASSVKIIKFNVPGAGKAKGQGTEPLAINKAGAIAGFYLDSAGVEHGFLRSSKGAITKINAPGAATTQPESMNTAGDISGFYTDSSGVLHGFLRTTGGSSPPSTLRTPALVQARAPRLSTSTHRGRRSREFTLIPAVWLTASCALPTVLSLSLVLRAREQKADRARSLQASTVSTMQARFPERMRIRPEYFTASCALRRALSLNSLFRAQAQVPAKGS